MSVRKRKTRTQRKKANQAVKVTIYTAISLFLILSVYFVKTGIIGMYTRNILFGFVGFAGYFIPIYFLIFFILQTSPSLKKIKSRFQTAITLLLISIIFVYGIINLEEILNITLKDNVFINSYNTGKQLKSTGVFGNMFIILTYKALGKLGLYITTVLLFLLSLFFFTRYSIITFKDNVKKVYENNKDIVSNSIKDKKTKESKIKKKTMKFFEIDSNKESKPITIENSEYEAKTDIDDKLDINDYKSQIKNNSSINISSYKESKEIKKDDINEIIKQDIGNYNKPSIDLFQNSSSTMSSKTNKKDVIQTARKIEHILDNFQVKTKVVHVTHGPIINRYELELEPGTKISKIANLSDDIAMHLAVPQVRVAPVAGKAAVGLEVPNSENSLVFLGDILASNEFSKINSKIKFALGKDISGKPIVSDLAKMPHLLIAGSTGSGKSVCINTIITSFLFNANPEELKLLMIDPKVVELNNYNGIPHLALPVVTDPKKASMVLSWAVSEMSNRYDKIAAMGTRDIDSYNKKAKDDFLPRIVIIIDELADLMMVAPSQVEDSIARITQMARAAGIHLIVATQRPSADVITGQIKTNIPSRISFAVSSAIDSRIILDRSGAEKLLGKGDMLFQPMGANSPNRIQGAFISDHEISKIVKFIKEQNIKAEYNEEITSTHSISTPGLYDEDELLEDAIKLVIEMKSASASMLQRRFRIGYNRAGRLIDFMEERGIVGPSQGSKPRDVLINSFDGDNL